MSTMMKAAVVRAFGKPLVIEDVPIPGTRSRRDPGQGRGLRCLSHRSARRSRRLAGQAHPSIHSGPRMAGHVVALGPGVTSLKEGDRVGVPWLHSPAGCGYCLSGWETLCPHQTNTGYSVDGGFAEYLVAPAAFAVR